MQPQWTYSDDLEEIVLEQMFPSILELHTKNKRPSTLQKHQKGLATLQRDQGGEKKDARRKYYGGNKRRKGVIIRLAPNYFGPAVAVANPYAGAFMEVAVDQEDGWVEIFLDSSDLNTHLLEKLYEGGFSENAELGWLDFATGRYFWFQVRKPES